MVRVIRQLFRSALRLGLPDPNCEKGLNYERLSVYRKSSEIRKQEQEIQSIFRSQFVFVKAP